MSDLGDAHSLDHFFRRVKFQRKAFRIIGGHIGFPAFDPDFFIKCFLKGCLLKPSGLIVDPAFDALSGGIADGQPHGEVIAYGTARYGQR